MTPDHERVQEALAAYALRALDAEGLREVEYLMEAHLPGCAECRSELEAFGDIAGELALAAGSRRPPRVLSARILREVDRPSPARRTWLAPLMAAAAVVVVAGLAAWTTHLSTRVSRAERRQANTTAVLTAVSHPQSRLVPLPVEEFGSQVRAQIAAAFVPGNRGLYLFGSIVDPRPDRVYQLWLGRGGQFASAGTFVPDRGVVLVQFQGVDASIYDGLLITEEPSHGSPEPSERHVASGTL